MNVYFEITDCMVSYCNGHKHLVVQDVAVDPHKNLLRFKYRSVRLIYSAERVWVENGSKITFLKNRYAPPNLPVDRAEFMWIKLKSHEVR